MLKQPVGVTPSRGRRDRSEGLRPDETPPQAWRSHVEDGVSDGRGPQREDRRPQQAATPTGCWPVAIAFGLLLAACGEETPAKPPASGGPRTLRDLSDAARDRGAEMAAAIERRAREPLTDSEVDTYVGVLQETRGGAAPADALALALSRRRLTATDWAVIERKVDSAMRRAVQTDAGEPGEAASSDPSLEVVRRRRDEIRRARAPTSRGEVVVTEPGFRGAGLPVQGSGRALGSKDVEACIAILWALGEVKDPEARPEALARLLRERGIDRGWWDEMSGRVVSVAIGWVPRPDMPIPHTWTADLRVVEPYRDRIHEALAH